MRFTWALMRLVRLDSSILGFLTLFVPLLSRTRDAHESANRALPLLFIWFCAFVANDLDDQDRDGINHPARPLPKGDLTPEVAVAVYFCSLALSLLTIKQHVPEEQAFWYYGILAAFISYHYVVEHLPALKSVYVAGAIAAPIVLLTRFFPAEPKFVVVAGATFCLVLGRELCMDLLDRAGDRESTITRLPAAAVGAAAFGTQLLGVLQLLWIPTSAIDWSIVITMAAATAISCLCWFGWSRQRIAIRIMKGQLLLGLVLLR